MIRLENIITEHFHSLSLDIKKGSECKVITRSEYENRKLVDIILGLEKPASGRVFLFDKDIYAISEKSYRLFSMVGAVLKDGGLISNLKVWENIVLPAWYHTGKKPEDMEEKAFQKFKEAGIDTPYLKELMGKLPGPLPVHEKRLIGLIRAMLMEPELMIYDSLFEGLSPDMLNRLMKMTTNFHTEKPGRTSVYITFDEQSTKDLRTDTVLRL
jgi:phospholipid/cholesterol/gamma-HCH transport system ATP-binding protein